MMFRRQVLTLLPDATTVHTAAILCLGFPFAVAKVPTASAADYLSRIICLVVFTDPRSRLETFPTLARLLTLGRKIVGAPGASVGQVTPDTRRRSRSARQ